MGSCFEYRTLVTYIAVKPNKVIEMWGFDPDYMSNHFDSKSTQERFYAWNQLGKDLIIYLRL